MRECGSKERAIYTVKPATGWTVVVDAVRTEELDGIQTWQIAPSARQDGMAMTKHPGTKSEMASFVLVYHLLHSVSRQNVSLVNKTVEKLGGGFDD